MSEVNRYTFDEICESGDFNHEEEFVLHSDYEKLKAQLERAEEALMFECYAGKRAREYFKEKEQV